MVVIHRDHLSSEVGHSAGVSRVVLTTGLVLVGLGVSLFLAGVAMGMNQARHGGIGDGSLRLLPIGGASVVVGLLVAAMGMAMARRSAGE